jgi:hypothetical protein
MSSADPRISNCRHCQHYQLQGRRGGLCQKLNVAVRSEWSACSLALPAFSSPLDLKPIDLPQIIASANAVIQGEAVLLDTLLDALPTIEAVEARHDGTRLMALSGEAVMNEAMISG